MRSDERLALWGLGLAAPNGTLIITLPDGDIATVGGGEPVADLIVKDRSAIGDILRSGLMGFAESYMEDRVDTSSLPQLLRWGLENQSSWFEHPLAHAGLPVRRIWQKIRPNRRHPRVRSMNDHYNLGNDFYRAWLDETMTYSSAKYQSPTQPLRLAQKNKYRTIAEKAGISAGMRVLEIGCGWGGFAEYAAGELGATITAITLSVEQAEYAQKRVADAGLGDKVTIEIKDFREVEGEFDAVVSIEMIESVDETNWAPLFHSIASTLGPDGRAVMQIITIDDSEWERYRSRADFIQQYIFPGGQIPAPKVLNRLEREAGLELLARETFGLDYARTLGSWRQRFVADWARISADNRLDERFFRMWDLYLSLCEAGFRMGRIDVQQWVFSGR